MICNIRHAAPEPCTTVCSLVCGEVPTPTPPVPPIPPIPPPEPSTPLTIMAGNVVAGWDAESLSSTPVASWPDLGPGGFTLTAAGGAQPTWNAAGGPNGEPSVLFDGVTDVLVNATLNLPAPGTTPTFYWAVMRQITWTPTDRLCGAGVALSGLDLFDASGSPNILQGNPGPSNAHNGLTLNVYKRLESYFSASIADYTKAGASSPTTGASAGNNDPAAGFTLGAAGGSTNFSNIEVCEFWIFDVEPNPAQKVLLDAYVTARYGPGLV